MFRGLEFDHVFLIRFNEGILPSAIRPNTGIVVTSAHEDSKAEVFRMEEERRCAYVAITRTRESLVLSFVVRDDDTNAHLLPSRFLEELEIDQCTKMTEPTAV